MVFIEIFLQITLSCSFKFRKSSVQARVWLGSPYSIIYPTITHKYYNMVKPWILHRYHHYNTIKYIIHTPHLYNGGGCVNLITQINTQLSITSYLCGVIRTATHHFLIGVRYQDASPYTPLLYEHCTYGGVDICDMLHCDVRYFIDKSAHLGTL